MRLSIVKLPHFGNLELPKYETAGSAGMDLRAAVPVLVAPGARVLVPTGLSLAIPAGFVGMVCGRSGLALRSGIQVMAGVIDSDYRGELGVILGNMSHHIFEIERGDRVAQLVVQPVIQVELAQASVLATTERGQGGYGSTGR